MTQIHYYRIQIPKGTTTQHILIISNKHILILVRSTNRDAYTHRLSIVVSGGDIPNQHWSLSSIQNTSNNEPWQQLKKTNKSPEQQSRHDIYKVKQLVSKHDNRDRPLNNEFSSLTENRDIPSMASLGVLKPIKMDFQNRFPPFPGLFPFLVFFELRKLPNVKTRNA